MPKPTAAGEERTCVCGARYVAVRAGVWRRLHWRRNLFTLPLHLDQPDVEDDDESA
ncbi:hypothetical protein K1T35_23415 [Pseudonocardia sp. DSM 110487]|uniref:hypothetical protein n=1 Tax=Pseudonocardia sp. DSM 110487 TaxID=2865833 RepID=UPI001C6A3927|nr:hypothetical protein [Pseudonocardia sp. DSM 110487]QYN39876.1 hypothetical protein K1T35_23415 [Pseudonocardia sp. DSM 110487]